MLKHLPALLLLLVPGCLDAQTRLFFEDFSSGAGQFTLNTTDVASSNAPDNWIFWIVNDHYTGGMGITDTCSFPNPLYPFFSPDEFIDMPGFYYFPDTPHQPAGITGGPTGSYMHLTSPGGPLNAGHLKVDSLCVFPKNYFTRMTSDISTEGYDTISVSFWWTGSGADSSYIEVYYSIDEGGNWTKITDPLGNYSYNPQWLLQTISLPEFANQATLRIGFRQKNQPVSGTDEEGNGYGIDDFTITANPPSISTGFTLQQAFYCPGDSLEISYEASSGFEEENMFIVQLSDTTGSFLHPLSIGTLDASGSSGLIFVTIPRDIPPGSGYRVRVLSTDPPATGTSNDTDIPIAPLPTAGFEYIHPAGYRIEFTNTSTNADIYHWTFHGYEEGIIWGTSGDKSPTFVYPFGGLFPVMLVATNECGSDTLIRDILLKLPPDGVEEVKTAIPIAVYPNPLTDFIRIEWFVPVPEKMELSIFNTIGMQIHSEQLFSTGHNDKTIDLSGLPGGIYFVKLAGSNGTAIRKILKH